MSDKEESSASKRSHETDDKPDESGESSDEWVGPLPTEAAPAKKRKGKFFFSIFFKEILRIFYNFDLIHGDFLFQFWNMRNCIWKIYRMLNAMRKVTCIVMLLHTQLSQKLILL